MAKNASSTSIRQMYYVFDVPQHKHRWLTAIREIGSWTHNGNFTVLSRKVVCANWMGDHRVSDDREQAMLDHPEFCLVPDGDEWIQQQSSYFKNAICLPASGPSAGQYSAYRLDFNDPNRIPNGRIASHDQLVHVGSVTTMLWRLSSAENATYRVLMGRFNREFALPFPEREVGADNSWERFVQKVDELCQKISDAGEDRVRDFAGFLVNALGNTQPPWWACFSQEVTGFIKSANWVGLCRNLGLGHLEAGNRLLFWRYPVRTVTPLYRPTVVEANDNPYHFPSPPSNTVGIVMPLDPEAKSALREVIHAPLFGDEARDYCTGIIGILDESPVSDHTNSLLELRKTHRRRLRAEYPTGQDTHWLNRAGQSPWP